MILYSEVVAVWGDPPVVSEMALWAWELAWAHWLRVGVRLLCVRSDGTDLMELLGYGT